MRTLLVILVIVIQSFSQPIENGWKTRETARTYVPDFLNPLNWFESPEGEKQGAKNPTIERQEAIFSLLRCTIAEGSENCKEMLKKTECMFTPNPCKPGVISNVAIDKVATTKTTEASISTTAISTTIEKTGSPKI